MIVLLSLALILSWLLILKRLLSLLLFSLATQAAFGQTDSLALSSGTTAANGTVSLTLALSSPAGNGPAALQWTLTYPASNVLSISALAGPSATNAGKTLSCRAGLGLYTCLASGVNSSIVQNGTVAIVTLTIAAGVTNTSIGIGNTVAASSMGQSLAVSATGGTVSGPKLSAPTLTSLSCNPTSLASGTSAICTVQLSQAAPAGGTAVSLSSSNALLPVPGSSITVPAGSATATFIATAGTISSAQNATLTATLSGVSQTATIGLVSAVTVSSLTCNPMSLTSGTSATCTVTLSKAAPAGGTVVSVSSDNVLLPVPASAITVPAGSTTTTFSPTADNIVSDQSAIVFATLHGVSQTVTIALVAPVSNVRVSGIMSSGATISWTTTEASDSQVVYGTTSSYESASPPYSMLLTSHSVNLRGLVASTTYHYQVLSRNLYGNLFRSGDLTFKTTALTVPPPLLQLNADATELTALTNGTPVIPSVAPAGFTGTVVVNGSGSVNFAPAEAGNGVYFRNCCGNTNNAYYKFTGASVGDIFSVNQGQISFYLKSRYSFAQRVASAAGQRYAFDVRDGSSNHLFSFMTQITSGRLVFTYLAGGFGTYYDVPQGIEDALFGNGLILKVTITWNAGVSSLYLNDALVRSTYYIPTANWTTASNFDLGAYEYLTFGGYDSSDDVIDEFMVSR
jgi:hypothetical protein